MLTFSQSTGEIRGEGIAAVGYSGFGEGKNNPAMEGVAGVGPIPRGVYTFGPLEDHPKLGKNVFRLVPKPGTDTFGRDGFYWHGESISHPGEASHGCIVSAPAERLAAHERFTEIEVVE